MAKFYKTQQKFIDRFLKCNPDKVFRTTDDLPDEIWEHLMKIRNTETLWTDVDRYLNDKIYERAYGGR